MDRYQQLFTQLSEKRRGCICSFRHHWRSFNPEQSLAIIQTLVDAGANAF